MQTKAHIFDTIIPNMWATKIFANNIKLIKFYK